MDRLTDGQKPRQGPTDEPTYKCADCLDTAYLARDRVRQVDICSVAWFCGCHAGRAAESGHWFDKVYEQSGNTRVRSERGERKLGEYLAARPFQRVWLLAAIEHLRQRHEENRRRKLADFDGSKY